MSEPTKACNLTEDEIHSLISHHCCTMTETTVEAKMERLNYLHKRLKAFKEVELTSNSEGAQAIASTANAAGWGSNG